ncbi:unnamed protein product, partial [Oppiella nova]
AITNRLSICLSPPVAVKRLYREAKELLNDRTAEYFAQPLDDNLFEWHFTVRGPPDSDFFGGVYHGRIILPTEYPMKPPDFFGGVYHGRIILPTEYPMKPPSIIMLTPNGRFEVNKKICLSISGHHPESWQPSWSIRTALLAIIGFMPTEGLGAIGSLDYPPEERKSLAQKSQNWCCPSCGQITKLLKTEDSNHTESEANKEAKELAKQICFKQKESTSESTNDESVASAVPEPNASTESTESNAQSTDEAVSETELIHRNVNPTHSASEAPTVTINATITANVNLESDSRLTNYLIAFICLAIAFLLFRRIFLL